MFLGLCQFGRQEEYGGFHVVAGGKVLKDADERVQFGFDIAGLCWQDAVERQNHWDVGDFRSPEAGAILFGSNQFIMQVAVRGRQFEPYIFHGIREDHFDSLTVWGVPTGRDHIFAEAVLLLAVWHRLEVGEKVFCWFLNPEIRHGHVEVFYLHVDS